MGQDHAESVQLSGWCEEADFTPQLSAAQREELLASYETVMLARDAVMKAIEDARNDETVNKSQEVAVTISGDPQQVAALQSHDARVLAEVFIVSDVTLEPTEGASGLVATVRAAEGEKCPRCWNYRELGEDGLCARCHDVVATFEE